MAASSYVRQMLSRPIKFVTNDLSEPTTITALREIIIRRARAENGHYGRGDLTVSDAINALRSVEAGKAGNRLGVVEFLGAAGLVKIFGPKTTITAAGSRLLADAKIRGVS